MKKKEKRHRVYSRDCQKKLISRPKNKSPSILPDIQMDTLPYPYTEERMIFTPYEPPPGIRGGSGENSALAMDSRYLDPTFPFSQQSTAIFQEGIGFLGYSYLAQLSMRAEYRNIIETRARESVREWIRLTIKDKSPESTSRLRALERELVRFEVKKLFADMVRMDGYFGLGHLYIDLKTARDEIEKRTILPYVQQKIKQGDLNGFRAIEPIWTTPCEYSDKDPLTADYYRPSTWWVQGQEIHSSRLLSFVSQPVPDVLKPVFNFGGISLSQMCKPYVDNWLRTRQSVSDMIHSFSIMVLKTDLAQLLQDGKCQKLTRRAALSNAYRDSRGLQVIDREREDFTNVSAPLTGLDKLQAQAQEQIASIAGIPLVKLLGVTPSGLNASSDGEIRCFYDTIAAFQETFFRPALTDILMILQLNLWGEIDYTIDFEFRSLWQIEESERLAMQKTRTDMLLNNLHAGLVGKEEARHLLNREGE